MNIIECKRDGRKDWFILTFQYDYELINNIKEIEYEYRKFNSKEKTWNIKTYYLYKLILKYKGNNKIFFKFDEKDKQYLKNKVTKIIEEEKDFKEKTLRLNEKKQYWLDYKSQLETTYKVHEDKIHQNLNEGIKLLPFQTQAVLFGDAVRNVLFALEMGTGKTLISIAYAEYNNFQKVFVITPNSLKFNYYKEVVKFTKSKYHVINWKKNKYNIDESKYLIINYDFFRNKNSVDKFEKLNIKVIDCLICDECHRLKNTESNTYINYEAIFNEKIFRNGNVSKIFMSGTPMNNRAYELYPIMNQISPLDFPNKTTFYTDYCGLKYDKDSYGGWVYDSGTTNFEDLYLKITPYVFRKRKDEVLSFLPKKIYNRLLLELNSSEELEYNRIKDEVKIEIRDGVEIVKNDKMVKMTKLRQYLSLLKVNNSNLIEFIDMTLERGEKIVIMDYHVDGLKVLHEKYKDISVLHYGEITDMDVRSKMVDEFQDKNSKIKMFLSTIQTGKEGLTLTAASIILVLTQAYTVSENEQVVDRIHRISQTEICNIYYPQYMDTIDYYIFDMVEEKKKEISKVLDNENYTTDMDIINIQELLNLI